MERRGDGNPMLKAFESNMDDSNVRVGRLRGNRLKRLKEQSQSIPLCHASFFQFKFDSCHVQEPVHVLFFWRLSTSPRR